MEWMHSMSRVTNHEQDMHKTIEDSRTICRKLPSSCTSRAAKNHAGSIRQLVLAVAIDAKVSWARGTARQAPR